MRTRTLTVTVLLTAACGPGGASPGSNATDASGSTETGDGDATSGDGDGDPMSGDGDGDGDPTSGDGDGDGDGDPTAGDGDGDPPEPVAIAVDSDGLRNCALRSDGRVKCWGSGYLGIPWPTTVGGSETPADVDFVDVGFDAVTVGVGLSHSCALSQAGKVRCWGKNETAALGYGTYGDGTNVGGANQPTPAEAGDVDVGGKVVQLAVGGGHNCVMLEDQSLRCWGGRGWLPETLGQLGYGNTEPIGDDELPSSAGPVPVGVPVVDITLGGAHTCVLTANATVRCWGNNNAGQLGLGHTSNIGDDETPAEVGDVPLPDLVTRVRAGNGHTCALLVDGSLICWGGNNGGQLGLGHTEPVGDDELPTIAVELPAPVEDFSLGQVNTCALSSGQVWCWGAGVGGANGQANVENLGDDETLADLPAVMIGVGIDQVSLGGNHVCALSELGEVLCWGQNDDGALGYGHKMNIGDDEYPASAGPVPLW